MSKLKEQSVTLSPAAGQRLLPDDGGFGDAGGEEELRGGGDDEEGQQLPSRTLNQLRALFSQPRVGQ